MTDDALIQALGVFSAVVVIIGVFIWIPWLDHRRDMKLLKKGLLVPKRKKPLKIADVAKYTLILGSVAAAGGAAMVVGSYELLMPETARWLRFGGLVVLFIGLGLVLPSLLLYRRGEEEVPKRRR